MSNTTHLNCDECVENLHLQSPNMDVECNGKIQPNTF